ncbi:MAG: ABC transporter permease subunit [Ignavibacteria bacterium]|nr:ABC transporter permease subunit [Ignavibacteria bacterium]
MNRIITYIVLNIVRSNIVVVYTLLLAALSWGIFSVEDNTSKGILTLLNVILLTVPLVSLIFSTIYLYNSSEFIELLLSQPIRRSTIWWSLFWGLTLSMQLAFLLGAGIPIYVYAPPDVGLIMIAMGLCITAVFVSIAFLSAILTRDKAKGIGIAIMAWLFFALMFDGLVLFLLFQFADYPIEKIMVGITALNPIDLARVLILLHIDVSAMMGYTGAIFKDFFGTTLGMIIALGILLLWVAVPYTVSLMKFNKKDL